jgi:ATP-dependent Lhr-like helicase
MKTLPIALTMAPRCQAKAQGGSGHGGKLKAVVCTSTLDLGIDWGDGTLSSVGAPKAPAACSALAVPITA